MLVKKAVYEKVMVEKNQLVSPNVYGCDCCEKEICQDDNKLKLTVFKHNDEGEDLEFCSWKCVFKYIPTINCDYFVSLPFLHFDKGLNDSKEFMTLMSKINK